MQTLRALWRSTVGKKAVMALTGILLFVWLALHLSGNLLVFLGAQAIDSYGAALHSRPWLIWPMRLGLIVAVSLHATAAYQLARRAHEARPQPYKQHRMRVATWASRSMRWGGVLLVAFIVFHLLHLTVGAVHPAFVEGSVYHNIVVGLRAPGLALIYIAAVSVITLHLYHGLWSARRSLGLLTPSNTPPRQRLSATVAVLLWLGFCSVPLAVLCGILR